LFEALRDSLPALTQRFQSAPLIADIKALLKSGWYQPLPPGFLEGLRSHAAALERIRSEPLIADIKALLRTSCYQPLPTRFVEGLRAYAAAVERIRSAPLIADIKALLKSNWYQPLPPRFVERLRAHAADIERIRSEPPIAGIEELLIRKGYEPLCARFAARFILFTGARWAKERVAIEKPLAGVLRRLSKSRTPAAVRREASKLRTWLDRDETPPFIETWLQDADLPLITEDLRQIAALAVNRDESACERLVEIAKALLPYLPDPRGRPVSRGTGIHLFLLLLIAAPPNRPSYTWSDVEGDFIDPLTNATRVLLNDPNFDPRPACRLSRSPEISRHDC